MSTKKLKILFVISWLLVMLGACDQFVSVEPPKNQLTEETMFADGTNAEGAVTGLYINLNGGITGLTSGGMTLLLGLAADELNPTGSTASYQEIWLNQVSVMNANNLSLWSSAYQSIYRANAIIAGLEESNGIGSDQKNRLTAVAKVIRSFCYFNLVNVYGDIPLLLSPDYRTSRLANRVSVPEVCKQIIEDLTFAQQQLPQTNNARTEVSYYAATALLAKVYLFKGEYAAAEMEASLVIGSGHYNLMDNPGDVFLENSSETIWSLQSTYSNRQTTEAYEFVPVSATTIPKYTVSPYLEADFNVADLRFKNWITNKVVRGVTYIIPYKYKANGLAFSPKENYTVLRLAEQYLIRAEARANLDKIVGNNSAEEDLYAIRSRAGYTEHLSISSKAEMLDQIKHERRLELFCEWGNRWADLKRNGNINDILAAVKTSWQSSDVLFPIPAQEINANPNLLQNEGYK